MSDIILHHYEMSPYSEKLRAMFGYLGLDWKSVITSEMPPRPKLYPLAGGYRRIPVVQVGADVYCDTKGIAQYLAKKYDKPELDIDQCDPEVKALVDEVEGQLFFACVMYSSGKAMNKKAMASMSLFGIAKLMVDRINMGRCAKIRMVTPKQAKPIVEAFLPKFEAQLQQDFIFGDAPNFADFSAYHPLWFIREIGEKPIIRKYPKICAWMDRMKALGHGVRSDINADEALAIAKATSPADIPDTTVSHESIGNLVEIAPDDYGLTPTTGVFKAVTETNYILERETEEAGAVRVYFPVEGYQLMSLTSVA